MEALQVQILGWLGYLDRWAVSWQIAFILCVAIATVFIRRMTQFSENTSSVVINDRKPYKKGTVIDLAHGAADALDIDDDGTADVSIEVLD